MPYQVKWGPDDGDVSIWNETATETLRLVLAYEDEGKAGFEITDFDGLMVSKDELRANAEAESPPPGD